MDFGALPPEVNSTRMHAGPGSAPMMAAATAWAALAAELGSTAASYDSVISELTSEEWMGPASASMGAAAMPYVQWMSSTGALAQQASAQAAAAAGAYEAAFAMTVPPAEVAANRALLMALVATNFLGQTLRRSRPRRPSTAKCGPRMRWRCTAMPGARRRPRR